MSVETGDVTGTKDKRDGADELAKFFRRAQDESRKGAEQGKEFLARRPTS